MGGDRSIFLACDDFGEELTIIPCLRFFSLFLRSARTEPTSLLGQESVHCGIGKLRRLWTNVPGRVACDLIFLIGISGQNSQPTLTMQTLISASADRHCGIT